MRSVRREKRSAKRQAGSRKRQAGKKPFSPCPPPPAPCCCAPRVPAGRCAQGGFTLIELMVVVSIALLLLAWGMPSYSTWKKKHDIENEMVQLYSDLQFGRMTAYSDKAVSGVWWGGGTQITSYQMRSDANNNNTIDDSGVDTKIGGSVKLAYALTLSANQNSVSFDGRGFLNTPGADPANPITFSVPSSSGAAVDCVAVSTTRIILGKMNGGTCAPK